jgi:hypothetical protein
MKALVFKEGAGQWAEDGEKVACVILVPDKSPSFRDIQEAYNKFYAKKLAQVSSRLEKIHKGAPTRNKDGHYSQYFFKKFEEIKRQEHFDIYSWIINKYDGKVIKFEENY